MDVAKIRKELLQIKLLYDTVDYKEFNPKFINEYISIILTRSTIIFEIIDDKKIINKGSFVFSPFYDNSFIQIHNSWNRCYIFGKEFVDSDMQSLIDMGDAYIILKYGRLKVSEDFIQNSTHLSKIINGMEQLIEFYSVGENLISLKQSQTIVGS